MRKNRLLLIFLSVAGVLGLGVVAVFAYLSYQIRDIKTPLLSFLQSQIAGELKIADAQVVFFPPGIDLRDTKLYAPGESEPAASIGKAELRFNLIPLVRKKFEGRLTLDQPEIRLHRGKDGKTNMERIFAPLLSGEAKESSNPLDQFWWKRIAIDKLRIREAQFRASQEGKAEVSELKNLSVEADHIRFDQGSRPANLKIRYSMPQVSEEPMELATQLAFDEASQGIALRGGAFRWGKVVLDFGGKALLPSPERKDVVLDLNFGSERVDLKDVSKLLKDPLPASGTLALRGTVTGTAFAPLVKVMLDSPALSVSGKNLSNLHAELSKQEKPIKIENTSFGIYGGSVGLSGEALPGPSTSANLNVALKSISLAAASGKPGNPARLSGNLKLSSPNVAKPYSFSGGGNISVGPFPLPVMNLQSKVKVAEILAAGTAAGQMINVGMLSSSANVIGTQIDVVNAAVRIAGNNITLAPFTMGNGHFSASGNATIAQQKSINGGGTFNLNPGVTARLITDPLLRSAVTGGKGALSVPFSISGPLDDPNISVDSGYLKGLIAKATAIGLKNMLMGGIQPGNMLNSALKNTPLGDPKNPLGQILGAPAQNTQTARTSSSTTARRSTATQPAPTPQQRRNQAIQKGIEGLLFGR
ncbi:MAG: AsmA-like C-terminal region-containing protein [bacterium]